MEIRKSDSTFWTLSTKKMQFSFGSFRASNVCRNFRIVFCFTSDSGIFFGKCVQSQGFFLCQIAKIVFLLKQNLVRNPENSGFVFTIPVDCLFPYSQCLARCHSAEFASKSSIRRICTVNQSTFGRAWKSLSPQRKEIISNVPEAKRLEVNVLEGWFRM